VTDDSQQQPAPVFPQYTPPPVVPNGIPTMHRDQAKPLQKIIKQMFKPRQRTRVQQPRTKRKKNPIRYY